MKYKNINLAINLLEKISKNVDSSIKLNIYYLIKQLKEPQEILKKVNNDLIDKYVLRGPYNEKKKVREGNIYFWDFGDNKYNYDNELENVLNSDIPNKTSSLFMDLNFLIEFMDIGEIMFLEEQNLLKIGDNENGRKEG